MRHIFSLYKSLNFNETLSYLSYVELCFFEFLRYLVKGKTSKIFPHKILICSWHIKQICCVKLLGVVSKTIFMFFFYSLCYMRWTFALKSRMDERVRKLFRSGWYSVDLTASESLLPTGRSHKLTPDKWSGVKNPLDFQSWSLMIIGFIDSFSLQFKCWPNVSSIYILYKNPLMVFFVENDDQARRKWAFIK